MKRKEITFIVTEDELDGGYVAHAHWTDGNRDLITQGDSREELLRNIREAIDVSFDADEEKPGLIHLHFVRDEIVSR
jgi:predicted RNase H-like HicB family nuclease